MPSRGLGLFARTAVGEELPFVASSCLGGAVTGVGGGVGVDLGVVGEDVQLGGDVVCATLGAGGFDLVLVLEGDELVEEVVVLSGGGVREGLIEGVLEPGVLVAHAPHRNLEDVVGGDRFLVADAVERLAVAAALELAVGALPGLAGGFGEGLHGRVEHEVLDVKVDAEVCVFVFDCFSQGGGGVCVDLLGWRVGPSRHAAVRVGVVWLCCGTVRECERWGV